MTTATASMTGNWPEPLKMRSDWHDVNIPASPGLGYVLFLMVNATVFLRPAEMVPALLGLPIYEALIFGCLFLNLGVVRHLLSFRHFYHDPITLCVMGVWFASVFSHVPHGGLRDMVDSFILFFKVALYYLLLIATLDTPQRFRGFLIVTALCSSIMVGLCVVDYLGYVDLEFVTHVSDRDGVDETGATELVLRMRGTGIFEDPNDISLLIVATSILCVFFLTDRSFGMFRWSWLIPLFVLATGLLLTRSRGGLLAGGAAFMAFILLRFGRGWSVLAGSLGALAIPLVAGRQGDIDLEGGTAQERIQMWAEGFDALKSPDLLFGIGQGYYADMAGLVAHNSYVHAFTELGLFGGTLFFGCFFFAGLFTYLVTDPRVRCHSPAFHRFAPYLGGILAGWCTGLFSLSRCYVVPTYMIVGMTSAYLALLGQLLIPRCNIECLNSKNLKRWICASLGMFVFLYLFIKFFARFG